MRSVLRILAAFAVGIATREIWWTIATILILLSISYEIRHAAKHFLDGHAVE